MRRQQLAPASRE